MFARRQQEAEGGGGNSGSGELVGELRALRQRKGELEGHLSALQDSRRHLMGQLEGLMKMLKVCFTIHYTLCFNHMIICISFLESTIVSPFYADLFASICTESSTSRFHSRSAERQVFILKYGFIIQRRIRCHFATFFRANIVSGPRSAPQTPSLGERDRLDMSCMSQSLAASGQ